MGVNRALISEFQFPKTAADWEALALRGIALLKQVPVKYWQFLIRCLLVLTIAVSLARFFWLIIPSPSIPPAAVAVVSLVNQPQTSAASGIDINQVKSLSVFGKAAPAPAKDTPAADSQTVDTRLSLVLLGVMASSDENHGKAIISSGDKSELYSVGETLPAGAGVTLSKVFSDRVIINNNGQSESLWLYSNDPSAKVAQQHTAPSPVPSPPSGWAAGGGRSAQIHSPASHSDPNEALQNASKTLSDVVAMSIYREGNQVVGYKIRPGRDSEKFRSLGLQTDDIVTSVNGMPLSNPAKIMEVFKSMGGATSASLEIKRSGTVMTIDVVL